MNVNKWGPGGWNFLHTMTFNYPLEPTEYDKERYSKFFNITGEMLPCKYCRNSYKKYIKYVPIEPFLEDREGVSYWLYRIHQLVNDKVFKKNVSFKQVVKEYEKIRAKCGKLNRNNDIDKKFKTCQIKNKKENTSEVDICCFVNKARGKYQIKIDNMVDKLIESDENPNIDYLDYLKKNRNIKSYFIDY